MTDEVIDLSQFPHVFVLYRVEDIESTDVLQPMPMLTIPLCIAETEAEALGKNSRFAGTRAIWCSMRDWDKVREAIGPGFLDLSTVNMMTRPDLGKGILAE